MNSPPGNVRRWILHTFGLVTALIATTVFMYHTASKVDAGSSVLGLVLADHSANLENPSVRLKIGDTVYVEVQRLTDYRQQAKPIWSKPGKYPVSVMTLDGLYEARDTIEVKGQPEPMCLYISYNHNPPVEIYTEYMTGALYKRDLDNKNYPGDTIIPWLMDSSESAAVSLANNRHYQPLQREFRISCERLMLE